MLNRLAEAGLFAVVRRPTHRDALATADRLVRGGIRILEVSFTLASAPAVIAELDRNRGEELLLGAGTVLTRDDALRAVEAGAAFLVCPGFSDDVATVARDEGVGYFPGAFTPTEVMRCWQAGATAVKVFPAAVAGTAMFRQLSEPLPQIPLVAVGGVSLDSAPAFLEAGAVAVGIGGSLAALEEDRIADAVAAFQAARS